MSTARVIAVSATLAGLPLNRLALRVHRVRPTWSRAVPDFSDDLIHPGEYKLAVPGYAQLDGYSCGATAGWAVVKTFHPKASFRSFYRACNPSLDGTTDARVIRALRCHGVGVSMRHDLTFAKVRATICVGFPIITGIGREVCDTGDHFVVIYGWAGIHPACSSATGHDWVVADRNFLGPISVRRGLPWATA